MATKKEDSDKEDEKEHEVQNEDNLLSKLDFLIDGYMKLSEMNPSSAMDQHTHEEYDLKVMHKYMQEQPYMDNYRAIPPRLVN